MTYMATDTIDQSSSCTDTTVDMLTRARAVSCMPTTCTYVGHNTAKHAHNDVQS